MFSKIKAALCGVWQWLKKQIQSLRFVATVVINSIKLEMTTMARSRRQDSCQEESNQVIPMQITEGVWSRVI